MAISRRETAMMVGGLLLGIAGAWALLGNEDEAPPAETVAAAQPQPSEAAAQPAAEESCTFDPIVAKAGKDDGELALEAKPEGRTEDGVRALLVTGKEAAAAGRPRDAEVAFLMACRAAGAIAGGNGMPLADARYRLGRHYAITAEGVPAARRGEMLQRARDLYTSSLQAYRTEYGADHEKTRFAANGLEQLPGQDEDGKPVTAAAGASASPPESAEPAPQPQAKAPSKPKEPAADAGEAEAQAAQAERKAAAAKAVQAKAAAAKAAADKLAQTEAAAAAAAKAQAAQAKAAEERAAQAKAAEARAAEIRAAEARAAEARAEAARAAEAEVAQAKAAEERAEARAERRAAAERRRQASREEAMAAPPASPAPVVTSPAAPVGQATGDPGVALPQ